MIKVVKFGILLGIVYTCKIESVESNRRIVSLLIKVLFTSFLRMK